MTKALAFAVCDNSRHVDISCVKDVDSKCWEETKREMLEELMGKVGRKLKAMPNFDGITGRCEDISPERDRALYPVSELIVSSSLKDGTKGPSAYIWLYVINDEALKYATHIMIYFDVDTYPSCPVVAVLPSQTEVDEIMSFTEMGTRNIVANYPERHKEFKFYASRRNGQYSLLIYDPSIKNAAQSIKSRMYAAPLIYN